MNDVSTVVVVGGGLAGLAAATRLADRGHPVTLLEERSRLGGATFSFPRDGLTVDNGQHVLLRCYTEYRALLDRWGTLGEVDFQPRFTIPVQGPDRRRHVLARTGGLPAPLHLGPALARYGLLSTVDRLRVLRGVAALRRLDLGDPALDAESFGDWLRRNGQTPATIAALWNLITVAALNADADEAALSLCAMVFRTALLDRADAADIGVPRIPLQRLHGDAAEKYLRGKGCTLRVDAPVRSVEQTGAGFTVRLDDAAVPAAAVVVAVPPRKVTALLPRLAPELDTAPIVNLHVVYDQPVLDVPMLAFAGSPLQWVFDRTESGGLDDGQYVTVSISAAGDWIDRPTPELRAMFVPELTRVLPRARNAGVQQFFVTRERHATFRQRPGSAAARLPARTAVPGITLAGAWTATGWPDTMEGAVRSGLAAADAVENVGAQHNRRVTS